MITTIKFTEVDGKRYRSSTETTAPDGTVSIETHPIPELRKKSPLHNDAGEKKETEE